MSFTFAIIGRPNVGKSTLFNRLVGQKLALVDDQPGVTRDRREGEGRLGDLRFTIIDTAGLDHGPRGSLAARMQEQTEAAIAGADALLFVIDARVGLTPADRGFADLVRKAGKPVVLLANKSEGKHGEVGAMESYALGLGDPVPISAEHGEGLSDLYDALREVMPEDEIDDDEEEDDTEDEAAGTENRRPIRVAIVGRPNAGKSTLINHLLGEERLLTSDEAGTTRDSIAVDVDWQGRAFRVFDTAGLRRRSRIEEKLEKLSVADSLRAVRFAEVVVLMMDAQHRFEEQDLRIADLVEREGRALVIAVSKSDLIGRQANLMSSLRQDADHWLPQIRGVPVVAVSGVTGEGVDHLMTAIEDAYAVWNKRTSTSMLNRWFEQAIAANPPPAVSGRRLKLNYVTQPKARPPSFVVFCSRADAVPDSYLRYLTNSMRTAFDMPGTPIRITLREKSNPFAHKAKRKS
ncbi:ribosome biogenesis GTPase Der [Bradyrhizobium sp. U87765 SZCCT0131]|uniref:ribosome biogenesis GTPase Der n=1 Tax=unclassified Bradyrhizobium TaxID=2631580 RepID=UPI001BA573AB|nr:MULTISPECIES: ribosome biogenesis GTPase Der [unclassified Bradyrhizobium]MBR1220530.1 ribosome biogenesis GTPase Der [Bradyrhizobium sp. U87765 SZCCT0131]MBR1263015.1 ribosome biogenesis GTPase Der [Bradyrhizobium sp. U87765 SZCCT0134]MBR1307102.1 ribosome biogenesis GTPase Der [Bradyrhizobium sp. U87765 SZCCT0110]MBR1323010.1 ribosome biogenesis GTPase Der [Bradyrhizobium sp. U87765 SZCCT0109]MBR1346056.1 ribosome biogenesis GTPase Der [Bradyrhizobium sp. U87765 SZCCT0048]